MKKNTIQDIDYNELLQQTVAVIEKARTNVARHMAVTASKTYWEIGKLLYEKKIGKFTWESGRETTIIRSESIVSKDGYVSS